MAWHLEGTYIENCPCDMVCPCATSGFTLPADAERCHAVRIFHVDSGEIEGTDVSGLTVGMLSDSPRLMAEGNWRVGLFMDEASSQEQAEKLEAVFSGQLGGPMEVIAALVGERLGVVRAPIEYENDGRRHRVRIGDFAQIEILDFVPPQTPEGEPSKITGVFHPANSTLTIAQATTSRLSAFGLNFSHMGKSGLSAPFSWSV